MSVPIDYLPSGLVDCTSATADLRYVYACTERFRLEITILHLIFIVAAVFAVGLRMSYAEDVKDPIISARERLKREKAAAAAAEEAEEAAAAEEEEAEEAKEAERSAAPRRKAG